MNKIEKNGHIYLEISDNFNLNILENKNFDITSEEYSNFIKNSDLYKEIYSIIKLSKEIDPKYKQGLLEKKIIEYEKFGLKVYVDDAVAEMMDTAIPVSTAKAVQKIIYSDSTL
jgi:hypothetical protein